MGDRLALRPRPSWAGRDHHLGWTTTAMAGAIVFVALKAFGLPAADLHSPLHYAGIMDPLCGMTRAMWLLGQGRFGTAWLYNPGAYGLAAAGIFLVLRALVGVTTRKWVTWSVPSPLIAWIIVGVAVTVLWINQQANADLLMSRAVP